MSVWTTAGLIADGSFDDPQNARIIYIAVGGLLLLAVLLGVGTWLWWRAAKVEHPVLAPLEVMGTRRWWKGDFNERRRRLDEVRPALDEGEGDDAVPVAPVDLDQVMLRDDPHTFDDLAEPGETVDAPVPVSADAPAAAEVAEAEEAEEAEVEHAEASEVEHAEASEVEHAEAVAVDEPAVEPEPVAAPEPEAEPETEIEPAPAPALAIEVPSEPDVALPELTFEPVVVAPQNIVIDTAPKPRDTLSDLGPEAVDSDPTPVPIDPLLRLQSE